MNRHILLLLSICLILSSLNAAADQGSIFILEGTTTGKSSIDHELTRRSVEILKARLASLGETGAALEQKGNRRIVLTLTRGTAEAREIVLQSIRQSRLEFRLVDDRKPSKKTASENETLYETTLDESSGQLRKTPFTVKKKPLLSGDIVASATVTRDSYTEQPTVYLTLNQEGTERFARVTERMVKSRLAIIVDGNIISVAVIQEAIRGGKVAINGRFTAESAADIATALNNNYLPATFRILSQLDIATPKQTVKAPVTQIEPADVDVNIPSGAAAGRYDIAVVIGNQNYSLSGASDVDYAIRDAKTIKEYLTRTMGFDPANIIYIENATLTKFHEVFGTERDFHGKLFKWLKPGESNVFVYYAGHGAPDLESGEAYFVPIDANPQLIRTGGYSLQTFYDNLAKLQAKKVTVIIDACFSGNTARGSLFKGTSALVRHEKQAVKPMNAIVITSSSANQVSSWYPEKQHSLFTYFFLKGLRGEADTNKDNLITVGEMRGYLSEHVPYMARRLTGNEQTPQISANDDDLLTKLK